MVEYKSMMGLKNDSKWKSLWWYELDWMDCGNKTVTVENEAECSF
jgi:hypothetical protein